MLRRLRQRAGLQGVDAAGANQLLCVVCSPPCCAVRLCFLCRLRCVSRHTTPFPPFPLFASRAPPHPPAGWLKTSAAGRKLVVGAGLISGNVTANGATEGRCVLESIPRGTALVCKARDVKVQGGSS